MKIEIVNIILFSESILVIVFLFVEYSVRISRKKDCQHKFWTQYQSYKKRECIDCGYIEKLTKPITPYIKDDSMVM